ncbi:MAG: transcriptional regulator [Proteobacteria bacterium]|nr:transcriptional regulator [Pseudomonadota bacterium]
MDTQVDPSGWFATTDCQPAGAPPDRLAQFGQTAECRIIRDTFALLGDKWSLLIVRILAEGTFRFSELHRIVVGISQSIVHSMCHRHLLVPSCECQAHYR